MSITLYNPLDDFESYSVHYIMLACRTTEEAKDFSNEKSNAATLAAINKVTALGESVPFGRGNTAYLVMDTRRFAQFSISSLKYEVLINGLEKQQAHGNLATQIHMTIVDSVGISFINFIQYLMDEKMQCNFDGMIFMLRVLFVGHDNTGKSTTVQTVTIPMSLFKMELALDASKGTYNCEFMPNTNFNTSRHERWMHISNASQFFTGTGNNKLGAIVNAFEAKLNDASADFYKKASSLLIEAPAGGQAVHKANANGKYGRQVQYLITIPAKWENFDFNGGATANSTETVFSKALAAADGTAQLASKKGTPTDTHMAVEPGIQITQVLDLIFRQVKEIQDLGAGRKTPGEGGQVTLYKHFTGITSSDDTIIVHVDVVEFIVPNVIADAGKKGGAAPVSKDTGSFYKVVDGVRVPNNFAEFDYIFTGKNKDIMNFDMKMQDLTWMLASNLKLGAGAQDGVTANGQGEETLTDDLKKSELVNARPYDPILLPANTVNELSNFRKFASLASTQEHLKVSQDYTRNLSMFYAISPIIAHMTIRGNPDIMTKFNQSSFLPHKSAITNNGDTGNSTTNTSVKADYRKEFENSIIRNNSSDPDKPVETSTFTTKDGSGSFTVARTLGNESYTSSPVFIKVNIKGPNVNYKTNDLIEGQDFAKEVLYNNYYVVFKVVNHIEGGHFTQELELYSHNVFGMGKLTPLKEQTAAKKV